MDRIVLNKLFLVPVFFCVLSRLSVDVMQRILYGEGGISYHENHCSGRGFLLGFGADVYRLWAGIQAG